MVLLGGHRVALLGVAIGLHCCCLALVVLEIVAVKDVLDRRHETLILFNEHELLHVLRVHARPGVLQRETCKPIENKHNIIILCAISSKCIIILTNMFIMIIMTNMFIIIIIIQFLQFIIIHTPRLITCSASITRKHTHLKQRRPSPCWPPSPSPNMQSGRSWPSRGAYVASSTKKSRSRSVMCPPCPP